MRHYVSIPYRRQAADCIHAVGVIWYGRRTTMAKKNLLSEYSEKLAVDIAKLCAENRFDNNTVFQIKKSSSSVFANITEAQYPQSLADMHSKFEIARKECAETESWLKLIFASGSIDEDTFKRHRNLCGRIKRMLTASCITIENKLRQG
jgi:four helix bundle protein